MANTISTVILLTGILIAITLISPISVGKAGIKEGEIAYKNGDYPAALREFSNAAEQGHPIAQRKLAWMYENGRGVNQDEQEAMKWYRKAAEQGDANAQFLLGHMYASTGFGVAKYEDKQEAAKWFRKAAEQNHRLAQSRLGQIYSNGWGVIKDEQEAMKWYRKAAEQGDASARRALGMAPKSMNVATYEQKVQKAKKIEPERMRSNTFNDSTTAGKIAKDGRFIAYDNGMVLDTSTNLIWAAKDNVSHINWAHAKAYCESYRGGGYTDWRLPTQEELEGLYDGAVRGKYGYHLTNLIELNDCCPWASETLRDKAAYFRFDNGTRGMTFQSYEGRNTLALPVRSKIISPAKQIKNDKVHRTKLK